MTFFKYLLNIHLEERLGAAEKKKGATCGFLLSAIQLWPLTCIRRQLCDIHRHTDTQVCAWGLHPISALSSYVGLCSLRPVSVCLVHGHDCVEGFSHFCRLAPQSQFQR